MFEQSLIDIKNDFTLSEIESDYNFIQNRIELKYDFTLSEIESNYNFIQSKIESKYDFTLSEIKILETQIIFWNANEFILTDDNNLKYTFRI